MCVGVEQTQRGVQTDRYPDAVPVAGQLPHLALLTGVGVEGLLRGGERGRGRERDRRGEWIYFSVQSCVHVVLKTASRGTGLGFRTGPFYLKRSCVHVFMCSHCLKHNEPL